MLHYLSAKDVRPRCHDLSVLPRMSTLFTNNIFFAFASSI